MCNKNDDDDDDDRCITFTYLILTFQFRLKEGDTFFASLSIIKMSILSICLLAFAVLLNVALQNAHNSWFLLYIFFCPSLWSFYLLVVRYAKTCS